MLKRKTGNIQSTIKKRPKISESQKTIQNCFSSISKEKPKENSLYPQAYSTISSYLKDYKRRLVFKTASFSKNEKNFVIQGPAGCGKTHFVRQLGIDFGLKLLELNTSANRSRINVIKVLGEASQTFSIENGENSGTIIFIDDVDVILEPDQGFYKGIEFIVSINKCPVVMTCQTLPKFLQQLEVQVIRLDSGLLNVSNVFRSLFSEHDPELTAVEMKNILKKSGSNLNTVTSRLQLKEINAIFGQEVMVEKEGFVKVNNPQGHFEELWQDFSVSIDSDGLFQDFCENLQQIDLMETSVNRFPVEGKYRVLGFLDGIEKVYLKHRDKDEEFEVKTPGNEKDYKKITREHLVQMGDPEDFVSYLQVLKEFPVVLHPSYLLRHTQKTKATYFDIFLQKNPNLFSPGH